MGHVKKQSSAHPWSHKNARRIHPKTNVGLLQDFPYIYRLKELEIRTIQHIESYTAKELEEKGIGVKPIRSYLHNSCAYELRLANEQ